MIGLLVLFISVGGASQTSKRCFGSGDMLHWAWSSKSSAFIRWIPFVSRIFTRSSEVTSCSHLFLKKIHEMNHRHLQYKVTQKPGCPPPPTPPHHTTHREMLLSHEMNLRNSINEIANLIYGAVTYFYWHSSKHHSHLSECAVHGTHDQTSVITACQWFSKNSSRYLLLNTRWT